jgi:hypothetical protein
MKRLALVSCIEKQLLRCGLQTLTPDKIELVLEHSTWVLKADAEQGLRVWMHWRS